MEESTIAEQNTSSVQIESDTVTRIATSRGEIFIVGTAHVSETSAQEVRDRIEAEQPKKVCIELDANRAKSLNEENSFRNLDIMQIIRQKKAFLLLSNLVLSAYQKRLGVDLGTKPGDEMRAAVAACEDHNIPTAMVDRDIQLTLTRTWRKTGFWGKSKLLAVLIQSAFSREELDAEAIESLKSRSALDEMMKEMADFLPSVKSVLVDERDHYLAISTWREIRSFSSDDKTMVVLGAAHVPGFVRKIQELDAAADSAAEKAELEEISTLPKPSPIGKVLPWVIVAAVLGLIVRGFVVGGVEGGLQGLFRWVMVNGVLSAIGAAAALAHPLTILAAFVGAPITSMNPTIGVGFFTGIIEAYLRKPRGTDFETLGDDIVTVKGFFRNRITRILLVFFLSSVGSAIGTFIAIPLLWPT